MASGVEPRWNPGPLKSGRGGRIRTGDPLRPRATSCDCPQLSASPNLQVIDLPMDLAL